ncbi:hypothetical protein [Bacillus safensis]|uniref:hypothetical protein n=1 Tax=Bacillus safensis TaxID=561879 RepID=UPI000597379A|nr:hypothetical protein [Bacillus safensis]APJ13074.1 hypothetical protein BSL056_19885 [Bacillus safensis]
MYRFNRLYRLTDTEIWEVRLLNYNAYCYFSITDMNRKATIEDNQLATEEELISRDNYISIDVHSNVKLNEILEDEEYEELIDDISSFVEHMVDNAHVFFHFHLYENEKFESHNIEIENDEDLYGSKEEQVEEYKEQFIKNNCINLVEKYANKKLIELSDSNFCQDK